MSPSIRAEGIGIRFLFDRQRRPVTPAANRVRFGGGESWGLRDVSFTVSAGDGVALIGPSGSGKTTLLRTIAGVVRPDAGTLEIDGRVASLLSIDAGVMAVLTGTENARLLGVLSGQTRREADEQVDAVRRLSKLGEHFDRPVLSYSQGMRARLGFAVAHQIHPDILLLDEVHEALDHEFRQIVQQRAQAILDSGGIVIAAGHDHPMLARLCQHAFFFEQGHLRAQGPFREVQREYLGADTTE